ncbi:hypothetical protein MTO96_021458 [Rhipicephalus appendiculatus]
MRESGQSSTKGSEEKRRQDISLWPRCRLRRSASLTSTVPPRIRSARADARVSHALHGAALHAGTAAVRSEDGLPAASALFRSTRFAPAELAAYGIKACATLPEGYKTSKDVNKRTSNHVNAGHGTCSVDESVAFLR